MTEAAHESCGHSAGGPFLSLLSLFNAYEPVACLGEARLPRRRQVFQQSWFEYPYPIALRGDVRLGNRQERETVVTAYPSSTHTGHQRQTSWAKGLRGRHVLQNVRRDLLNLLWIRCVGN